MKLGARTFLPTRKAQEISGRIQGEISEKFSETLFQISRLFFGNFVQQIASLNHFHSLFKSICAAFKPPGPRDPAQSQEPLNAPFLNGLFSSGFSRGKTAP